MPRPDIIRNAFLETNQRSRYSKNWPELMMILVPATILSFSFAFWSQAPAGAVKPAAAQAPKPAATAKPAGPAKPGTPQPVSPVKAAASKAVAVAGAPKPLKPGELIVMTIGDEKIGQSQFEEILAALPEQFKKQIASPTGKREFARQYAEMRSIANEARKKMQQDGKVSAEWQLQLDQTLANLYMQSAAKVDDATTRKFYEEHKSEFENANGRHILIRFQGSPVPVKPNQKDLTDAEALTKVNDLRAKLVAGGDFAALAKAESDDTGSGAAGGALGDFARGQMVGPFDEAAFILPIGEISQPVKTQFGYHLIQIQSRKTQTFDEAKDQIERKQKPEIGRRVLDEVKKRNVVVLDETYFGKD